MNRDILCAEKVSQNLYVPGAFAEQKAVSAVFDAVHHILNDQTVAQVIVCDEIGERREALSLISAYHGGVPLVASAHAASLKELLRHPGIQLLHKAEIFAAYVGIKRDGHGGFIEHITPWEEANHAI